MKKLNTDAFVDSIEAAVASRAVVEAVIAAYGSCEKTREALGYASVMTIYSWRSKGLPKARLWEIHKGTLLSMDFLEGGVIGKALSKKAGSSHAA